VLATRWYLAQNANSRNCLQSVSYRLSRRRRGISFRWVAAIVIYPVCPFPAAGHNKGTTATAETQHLHDLSAPRCGGQAPRNYVQRLHARLGLRHPAAWWMIALYPAAQHTGALRKTAICSIPFEREMLSLSDTSKIYPIKHKKMRSTHVAQKLFWEMVSFLKDKWVIFIQNENRLLWTQSRSIR